MAPDKTSFAFVDRYTALGIAHPDLATICKGQCEGTGWVPVNPKWTDFDQRDELAEAYDQAVLQGATPDELGTIFVKCPTCDGTGKRRG